MLSVAVVLMRVRFVCETGVSLFMGTVYRHFATLLTSAQNHLLDAS